jgi:hypothetical protein
MKMIDKVKEAEKLIREVYKSKRQNVWVQASTVLRELDTLKYEIESKENK